MRDGVSVRLDGVPTSRWSIGGVVDGTAALWWSSVFRASVLGRPDSADIVNALCVEVTGAIARVLVDCDKSSVMVELVATPPALTSVSGIVGA